MDILLVLIAILGVVLILRGPSMLPRIGEALGRTVKTAREEIPSAIKDDPTADVTAARTADKAAEPPERPSVT